MKECKQFYLKNYSVTVHSICKQ